MGNEARIKLTVDTTELDEALARARELLEQKWYGVWHRNYEWYRDGESGIVFRTISENIACAQSRAMGDGWRAAIIGDGGSPVWFDLADRVRTR